MIKKIDKKTLKESMADTAIAMPIAWLLSYTTLALMLTMGTVNALYISIVQTLVLTIVSVIRKYCVRIFFPPAPPVALKGRSGRDGRLIVDSKNYVRKKTETDERSFCYREPLVCLFVCLFVCLSVS